MNRYKAVSNFFLLPILFIYVFIAACAHESLQHQEIGTKITQSFKIGDKIFYLPEGEWTVIATGDYTSHLLTSFKPGPKFNWVYLADIRGKRLNKAVLAYANIQASRASDWSDQPCERTDFYYKNDMKRSLKDQFCLSVAHNFPYLMKAKGQYNEIGQRLMKDQISVPTTVMAAMFTRYFLSDFIFITYYFNPEVNGITPSKGDTWETNDWNKKFISRHPEKQRYAEQMVKWGNQMVPLTLYGFNREGQEPQNIPNPPF